MTYTVNADYEERNTLAIHLEPGQEVTSGPADNAWPGWIWATDHNGRSGYVPAEYLEPLGEDRWAVLKPFDPTVLKVQRGDKITSLEHIHGWHWAQNQSGQSGWIADYLLKPATA